MSTDTQNKDDRINLRLKQDVKLILARAASFEGKTISNFILNSALDRAEQTIKKHEVISLNRNDAEQFFNALTTPVRFNEKLIAAFKEHEQRVNSKS